MSSAPPDMPSNDEQSPSADTKPSGDVWLGGGLIVLALAVFSFSRSIKSLGLGENFDPGSKAFPVGLAIILALGGAIEIWHSRKAPSSPQPGEGRVKTTLTLLVGLGAYVFLLPWLGFALSTLVLGTSMMVWLGNSWLRSIIATTVLIAVVYGLFVIAFKVPLPGGVLNLPF
jgi:predicted secreted protein